LICKTVNINGFPVWAVGVDGLSQFKSLFLLKPLFHNIPRNRDDNSQLRVDSAEQIENASENSKSISLQEKLFKNLPPSSSPTSPSKNPAPSLSNLSDHRKAAYSISLIRFCPIQIFPRILCNIFSVSLLNQAFPVVNDPDSKILLHPFSGVPFLFPSEYGHRFASESTDTVYSA
jgi:hypothetical protein